MSPVFSHIRLFGGAGAQESFKLCLRFHFHTRLLQQEEKTPPFFFHDASHMYDVPMVKNEAIII